MTSLWTAVRRVELVVVLQQLASALFDTALQMVVKERCAASATTAPITEESRQKAMSDFYMTYNLLAKLTPILPAILLAKLGDRGWRKAPIIAPLAGYVMSRLVLLLLVLQGWPLEVMCLGVVLHGLSGGFCSFWAGVMTLVSLGSTERNRSRLMMRVELMYGVAGLVGSLASGHLFQLYEATVGQGTVLVSISLMLYLVCIVHSVFLLRVSVYEAVESEALLDGGCEAAAAAAGGSNLVNIALLLAGGILYDVAVAGAMEILVTFQMKEPLNWSATQVGYGNAAGFLVFLTSFLGVVFMSRCLSDVSLIMTGMVSFASGIYFMAFVTETYMFYLARSLTLFALIPMPTIRSLLSQQVRGSSYGITLTSLQLACKVASLAYTPAYTKMYQYTLDRLPGLVFILSSVMAVLAIIPIRYRP